MSPATLASSGACNRSRGLFSWGVSTLPEFPTARLSAGAGGGHSFLASDFSNCSSRLDRSDASIPISLMKACTTASGPWVRGVGRKDSFLRRAGWTAGSLVVAPCLGAGVGTALATGEGGFSLGLVSCGSGFSLSDAGSSIATFSADTHGGALIRGLCTGEDALCFRWGDAGTSLTSTWMGSVCGAPWPAAPRLRGGAIGTAGTLSGEPAGMPPGSTLGGGTTLPTEVSGKGGGGTAGQNGGCCSPGPHPKGP